MLIGAHKEELPDIMVRVATPTDADLLVELCSSTFYDTYTAARPALEKDFVAYIKGHFSKEKITSNLSNPKVIYVLAEKNNMAAGYCKINLRTAPEEINDDSWIQLEEIYVAKGMVGQGFGKKLMEEFLKIGNKQGSTTAWLAVWDGNQRAIDFYKQWGFEVFGSQQFKMETTADIDVLMKKYLGR